MKRRIVSIVLIVCLLLCMSSTAFAALPEEDSDEIQASGMVTAGLDYVSEHCYNFYATIKGATGEAMSVGADLYYMGNYITSISASGVGPIVTTDTNLMLANGTYRIYVYGQTTTNSPATTITVTI